MDTLVMSLKIGFPNKLLIAAAHQTRKGVFTLVVMSFEM